MKVPLRFSKIPVWNPPGHQTTNVTRALPYFLQSPGRYVHRVRSAHAHWRYGKLHHISVHWWCGNLGSISPDKPGRLFEKPPEGQSVCATCEGRAIGAGENGTVREINGVPVIYSPRTRKQ